MMPRGHREARYQETAARCRLLKGWTQVPRVGSIKDLRNHQAPTPDHAQKQVGGGIRWRRIIATFWEYHELGAQRHAAVAQGLPSH